MRSRDKLILIVGIVLGIAALSAGIAVAAGGSNDGSAPVFVSQQPPDTQSGPAAPNNNSGTTDDDGATDDDEANDDDGRADDDGAADDDAGGADDADGSLPADAASKASEAGLAATGGGTVLATESDDGGAGYEVEIRKADGSEAEVELDKNFNVVQRAGDD